MRLTFLSPLPNLFGGQRVIAEYAKHLSNRGHEVLIVCASGKQRPSFQSRLKRTLLNRQDSKPASSSTHYDNYRVPFRVIEHASSVSNSDLPDADVLVATFWKTAYWADDLSDTKGSPIYLIQHDEGTIHGEFAEATYRLPMHHVYVSQWIQKRVALRHPDARGEVVANAIDVDAFRVTDRRQPKRCCVGVMWSDDFAKKGTDVAIRAMQIAKAALPDLTCVAYGMTRPPSEFQHVFDRFQYCPTQAQLAALYQSCTAWLFPSRFEGFGLPILESMASGTPVIGTATGAGGSLIPRGGGCLVAIDDAEAMSEAIQNFAVETHGQWKQRSNAALDVAAQNRWTDATDRFEAIAKGVARPGLVTASGLAR